MTIEAVLFMYATEEGGRRQPIPPNWRPQIFYAGVYNDCQILGAVGKPGDNVEVVLTFLRSEFTLPDKTTFIVCEGRRMVATGVVRKTVPQ